MALVHVPSLEPFRQLLIDHYLQKAKEWKPDAYAWNHDNPWDKSIINSWQLFIEFKHTLVEQINNSQYKEASNVFKIVLRAPVFRQIPGHYCTLQQEIAATVISLNFTNNCGAKSISQLYTRLPDGEEFTPLGKHILFLIETWARTMWNTSLLVGSDWNKGRCLATVKTYGEGYEYGSEIWNLNYPNDPEHKILLYWKDLTKRKDEYASERSQWGDLPNSPPATNS